LTLNFNNETSICTLYGILAQPHGQGKLVKNDAVTYAEKFCLPRNFMREIYILTNYFLEHKGQCVANGLFELKADSLIAQNVIAGTTSANLVECLKSCLNTDGCKVITKLERFVLTF
jgi:hypothetical protein